MNIGKILPVAAIVALFAGSLQAQNAMEALRYGNTYLVGSARNIGVGGTMGGLGADLSVLSTNPAGIARYKSTVFSISPAIPFGTTEARYLGNTLEDNQVQFNLSHGGAAFAKLKNNATGWKGMSFGFSVNRLDQYNDDLFMAGTNMKSSLLDMHAALATDALINDGIGEGQLADAFPFDAGLTYLTYLINPDTNLGYTSVLDGTNPEQSITIQRRGGKYEALIGGGGNYNDVLYVGASVGIPVIQFRETEVIREEPATDPGNGFNFFEIQNELRTTGYGVNLKLGLLARPHNLLRIGLAFHTPTFIRMEDAYYTTLFADFDTVAYEAESPDGLFAYNLVTPLKFLADVGVLLKEYGFVGIEYEVQNPGKANYNFKSTSAGIKAEEDLRNDEIATQLTWQHHLKTGIEVVLEPVRLRAGFQFRTSGLAGETAHQKIYSGGIGYRGKHFFIDGAYSLSSAMESFIPYEFGAVTSGEADLSRKRSQITLTLGYKL